MTSRAAIEARVRRFFEDEVHVEAPSADTDLLANGALDSLVVVGLVIALEEELGARISLDELELTDLQSIGRIAEVFASRERAP